MIAEELDVTENTVRSRVRKMQEDGMLDISGYVDVDKFDGLQVIMIGIRTSSMDYISKGEEISNLKGVISVSVVTGRFDLIVTVQLDEDLPLLEFLKKMNYLMLRVLKLLKHFSSIKVLILKHHISINKE